MHTHARTHIHTHTHCSKNWVLVLVRWKYCEKRKVFSLVLKDDRLEQCPRSCGNESKCGVQSKRNCESYESCIGTVRFSACRCQKKSVVYKMECQRGKQDQNRLEHWNAYKQLYTSYVLKWEASVVFPGKASSGDGRVPREWVLQQSFEFSGEVGWQTYMYP